MAPKTTTGIQLMRYTDRGDYALLGGPLQSPVSFPADAVFADIASRARLSNGYWLRATPKPNATTWTWVQL